MTHSELTEVEAAAEIEAELPSPSPDSPGSRVDAAPHETDAASRESVVDLDLDLGLGDREVGLGERRGRYRN
jgi:hypothetical protein